MPPSPDSDEHPSLAQLQRWLLAVITHPGGVEEGTSSTAAQQEICLPPEKLASIIPPSSQQTSEERLGVYAAAYFMRLVDCLREFFPCLRYAMGAEVFAQFALGYLQKYPSRSYTLNRLADQFADFLQETKPRESSAASWEEFFIDLARLEHAIEETFDAAGPETSPSAEPPHEPLDPQSVLDFVPGFRLLSFRFPVSSYYTSWKQDEQPELPPPGEQYLALFRRDYIVRRLELSPVQHELLTFLHVGKTLEESLAQIAPAAIAAGASAESLINDVRTWFEQWTRVGVFA